MTHTITLLTLHMHNTRSALQPFAASERHHVYRIIDCTEVAKTTAVSSLQTKDSKTLDSAVVSAIWFCV